MKRILVITVLISLLIITIPTGASAAKATLSSVTDRKLTDLSNRFSSLEASWGRFRLGGSFSLTPYANFTPQQNVLPIIEYDQEIGLFFDAFIDNHLQFSLKLDNQRGWGTQYQYLGSLNLNPLQIGEAFLRMQYPKAFNYFGRFRFSLGTLGIISDFFTNPIEGFAIQQAWNKFQLVAIYNRVSTLYNSTTNQVISGTDYLAGRIGWSNRSDVIGLNIVPKGLGGERNFSMDWSRNTANYKIAAELGWYSFYSTEYSDLNTGPTPGFMVSYGRNLTSRRGQSSSFIQLKAGYFTSGFQPSYSSLAHVSGSEREWFQPNSKGIEIYWNWHNQLFNNFQVENRLIVLTPVESNEPIVNYRLYSKISKNITPVNQLQLGVDLKNFNHAFVGQIFAGWALRF
jgi:hypothetical protein